MFYRMFAGLVLALGLFFATAALAAPSPESLTPEQRAEIQRLQELMDAVRPQTGVITLNGAKARMNLGEDFYFLGAADAKRVLTEAWGNPPSSVEGVLGMVFPAGKSFLDDTWGAVITYTDDGYVADADAAGIDYAKLLTDLRAGEEQDNRARQAEGYPAIHLVQWAQQPSYDAGKHNLIWAKDLAFSDQTEHTLNYDVRVLGRRGVLSMNIIAGMDDLQAIGPEAARLMNTASFDPGSQYADYKEGTDKKAAYGVAGLIAGGAALAVAKKAGLLGILLLVLKKGGVILLAGFGGVAAWLRKLFGGKKGGEFGAYSREMARAPVDAEPDPGLAPVPQDPASAPDDRSGQP